MAMLKGIVLLFLVMAIFVDTPWGCSRPPPPPPPPGEVCCSGTTKVRQEPQISPYTGGIDPDDNPSSTVCYYHQTSKCLTCTTSQLTETQCCTEAKVSDPEMQLTEYLIHVKEGNKYYLNPLNGNNYLSMSQPDANGNSGWSIHGGANGGVGVGVKDSDCWAKTKAAIDAGSLEHHGILLRGFLYVTNE